MPDRRRFGHVNVVCVYSNAVLAGRRGMAEGAEGGGGGSGMRQLALSNGPARMGIFNHVQRVHVRGFICPNNPLYI